MSIYCVRHSLLALVNIKNGSALSQTLYLKELYMSKATTESWVTSWLRIIHTGAGNVLKARRAPEVTHSMPGDRKRKCSKATVELTTQRLLNDPSSHGGGEWSQRGSEEGGSQKSNKYLLISSHAFSPGGQALCNQRLCNIFPIGIWGGKKELNTRCKSVSNSSRAQMELQSPLACQGEWCCQRIGQGSNIVLGFSENLFFQNV